MIHKSDYNRVPLEHDKFSVQNTPPRQFPLLDEWLVKMIDALAGFVAQSKLCGCTGVLTALQRCCVAATQ